MRKVFYLIFSAILLASCNSPTSTPISNPASTPTSPQYQTIAWQPDGTGWTQFETNDPSTVNYVYKHIIPNATMTIGGTVKIGFKQNSGSATAQLGLVFGYLNANDFWVFLIQNYGAAWIGKWNGLSWQTYYTGLSNPIVQGAGQENDISLSYDSTNVYSSINTAPPGTIPNLPGLSGSGVGFIVGVDSSENFPTVPFDARFKQY